MFFWWYFKIQRKKPASILFFYGMILNCFVLLMVLTSIVGALVLYSENYYGGKSLWKLRWVFRYQDNDGEKHSVKEINQLINNYYGYDENNRVQSVVYTGDILEVGAEYILLGYEKGGPVYLKKHPEEGMEFLSGRGRDLLKGVEVGE